MDAIIIHNSFEISISLSPRIRRNDSSSNCMTGHPSRPQSKLATLVNHSGHPRPFEVQIPRHVSEWRRNEHLGTMPRSVPICFSFPPGLILLSLREKKGNGRRERLIIISVRVFSHQERGKGIYVLYASGEFELVIFGSQGILELTRGSIL